MLKQSVLEAIITTPPLLPTSLFYYHPPLPLMLNLTVLFLVGCSCDILAYLSPLSFPFPPLFLAVSSSFLGVVLYFRGLFLPGLTSLSLPPNKLFLSFLLHLCLWRLARSCTFYRYKLLSTSTLSLLQSP